MYRFKKKVNTSWTCWSQNWNLLSAAEEKLDDMYVGLHEMTFSTLRYSLCIQDSLNKPRLLPSLPQEDLFWASCWNIFNIVILSIPGNALCILYMKKPTKNVTKGCTELLHVAQRMPAVPETSTCFLNLRSALYGSEFRIQYCYSSNAMKSATKWD